MKEQNALLQSTLDKEVAVTYFALVRCATEARLNNYFIELRQTIKKSTRALGGLPCPRLCSEIFVIFRPAHLSRHVQRQPQLQRHLTLDQSEDVPC
jgi:hypothetical protein